MAVEFVRVQGGTLPAVSPNMVEPLTADALNRITSTIIAAAIRIHRTLGSGLLESAYLACLVYELRRDGLHLETQKALPLIYLDVTLECAYRADLVVERAVIVEVKALDIVSDVHQRQLETYIRLANCRVGLLLNFGARTMKAGIKRVVNRFPEP